MQHTVQRKRHIAKTITWRIVATGTTFLLAWIITGQLKYGAAIGGTEATIKLVLYYMHERAWHKSKFGIVEYETANE